jgi:hypothetical protein
MAFCRYAVLAIGRPVRSVRAIGWGARIAACAAVASFTLAGCGVGTDGMASLSVDPARYAGYHCKELVGQWNGLVARQKQLRDLIDKASEGGGGTVIAAVAYRGDYDTVLQQQKVLKRTAAEQNCELTPNYSSDQTIR